MKKLLDFLGNRPTMAEWTGGLWSRRTVGRRQCVNIHVNTRWARFSACTRPLLHCARSLTADGCTLAMYRKAKSVYGIAAWSARGYCFGQSLSDHKGTNNA